MRERTMSGRATRRSKVMTESGFSLLEMLIIVAIIGIISTFALMGMNSARASMRLQSSSRKLTAYMEKARVDSIRRHATMPTQMATVEVLNTTTYRVTMDFSNTGTLTARDLTLEDGVTFDTSAGLASAQFNWRGGNPGSDSFLLSNTSGSLTIDVSDGGDTTINGQVALPSPSASPITGTTDVVSNLVVPQPTPVPTSTITTNPASSLSIKNKGAQGTISVTTTNLSGANTITAATTASNLYISPSYRSMSGSGTTSFTVQSSGTKTGNFTVTINSAAGPKSITVSVTK